MTTMTDTKPTSVCKHGRVSGCVVCAEIDAATAELRHELAAIRSQPVPEGYTDIKDYIAEQEKDPVRKAALDEARVRLREELAKGPVPVEPMRYDCTNDDDGFVAYEDYDSLQSALQVAQQELKTARHTGGGEKVIEAYKERAEKAEADHKAAEQNVSDLMAEVAQTGSLLMKAEAVVIQHYCDYDFKPTFEQAVEMMLAERNEKKAVEASNKRLVELLNDASGTLKVYSNRHTDCRGPLVDYCLTCDTQKRIDELLREVENG